MFEQIFGSAQEIAPHVTEIWVIAMAVVFAIMGVAAIMMFIRRGKRKAAKARAGSGFIHTNPKVRREYEEQMRGGE